MDFTLSTALRSSQPESDSPLNRATFPVFESGTVQKLVGVLETIAGPDASIASEDLAKQLRSLADEFAKQGLAASFMGIMTDRPEALTINQQANDVSSRLSNLAERFIPTHSKKLLPC